MIRIGIIGDIGSGKSFVAKQFPFPVFNADIEVSKLYKESRKCFVKLKKALPGYIISFPVKKEEVSKAILSNKIGLCLSCSSILLTIIDSVIRNSKSYTIPITITPYTMPKMWRFFWNIK